VVEAGNPIGVFNFSEMKLNAPADDSKFNKPAATP